MSHVVKVYDIHIFSISSNILIRRPAIERSSHSLLSRLNVIVIIVLIRPIDRNLSLSYLQLSWSTIDRCRGHFDSLTIGMWATVVGSGSHFCSFAQW